MSKPDFLQPSVFVDEDRPVPIAQRQLTQAEQFELLYDHWQAHRVHGWWLTARRETNRLGALYQEQGVELVRQVNRLRQELDRLDTPQPVEEDPIPA